MRKRAAPVAAANRNPPIVRGTQVTVVNTPDDEESSEEEEEIEVVKGGMFHQGQRAPVPVSESRTYVDPLKSYLSLQHLPHLQSQLPSNLHAPFTDAARRCASAYLDESTEDRLLSFLALVKVGLPPTALTKAHNPVERLANYPMVPWPKTLEPTPGGITSDPAARAEKLVTRGKIGQAGKALAGQGTVAQYSVGVGSALQDLHPPGESNPFGRQPGPTQHSPPSKESIESVLRSFNKETSPGLSGWTIPLLQIAAKDPIVLVFLHTLTIQIINGTAPGSQMLCTSRITPLLKKEQLGVEGGIRPIAVGEVIYRLAMKSIVRHTVKREMLARTQFGVGTKGGVEPVIRLMDRAVKKELDGDYKYVTSLDFKNAFNNLKRQMISDGLRKYSPGLFRCAKWAYNAPTRLIVPGADLTHRLYSSEGVRQGDPLGPFLFSVAYRPLLESLQATLGDDFIIVAYLDDTYILSKSVDPLALVSEFFSRPDSCLQLNLNKCKTYELDGIRENGMEILGTMIGPEKARRDFLNRKIDAQIAKIERLSLLPSHQSRLLIFRACYQQDLRHLQRCLDTSDLGDVWDRLDQAYLQIITNMRGTASSGLHDSALLSLPVKMGGMGVLSHRECSAHARAASDESSDGMLAVLLGEGREDGQSDEVKGQGERCKEAFLARRDELMEELEDKERKAMAENGSVLGRKWLTAVPYNSTGQLSNFEISCALHYRTLIPPPFPCRHCAAPAALGHEELCRGPTRAQFTIVRHNGIVRAIADALRTVGDTRVEVEPVTVDFGSHRRNDLRVWGSVRLGNATSEHDVKVYSILGDKVHKSTGTVRSGLTDAPAEDATPWDKTLVQLQRYLNSVHRETVRNVAGGMGQFSPLVFSAGGLVEKETGKRMAEWQAKVSEVAWEWMLRRMSLGLVRARARTWEA
jgi:hypothetical protein